MNQIWKNLKINVNQMKIKMIIAITQTFSMKLKIYNNITFI